MTNPIHHSGLPTPAPIIQDTPLLQMPQDIVTQILTHLPGEEIGTSALVCRQFNQMLKDDDVWRILFYHHFPSVNPNFIENFKSVYKGLHSNSTKGVYALDTLTGHGDTVYSLAAFDGTLFSGSEDRTIKIWDPKTGQCTATLTGHRDAISSLAVFDGKLFSGSWDHTIKVWDLETGHCTATLTGNGRAVYSLVIFDGKLFSGCYDNTIKVWDLKTNKCTATLIGHRAAVCSLAIFDGELFSGSSDATIKVWDLKTGECTATLTGHTDGVYCLAIVDGELFSGSSDGTIKVWEVKTGECTATLTGHRDGVTSLTAFDGRLFSGGLGPTIKVWELETRHCTATLRGHGDAVRSLALFNGKLFSGSSDVTIKVWDFSADDRTIFQEIAELLENERGDVPDNLKRFSRMPKTAKHAIYGKLYEILKPFANDYWGCGEHAFHNQHGQCSTRAQKAQAIRNYLNDQPPKTTLIGTI